jgi:hypothetical protein
MPRPRRNDGKIHLHERRNGNRVYASSNEGYDRDGKRHFRIVDWGTIEGGKVFIPNKRFLYEKDRWNDFIFPENLDLSKFEELKNKYKPGRPATTEDRSLLYGSVWFLVEIATKIGLIQNLMDIFDGNVDIVHDILTLAFFPLLSGKSYNHLAQWQRIERMPSVQVLTSKDITLLTQRITESDRMELFRHRMKRIDKSHVLAIDSTSKSSYGSNLADIRWGKNKEGLPLRQTNEVVVYSLNGHQTVLYQELPGNIPDLRTVELLYKLLEHAECPHATWLTDRGYPTQSVLDFLIGKGQPFICCIKASSSIVSGLIESIRDGSLAMEINVETRNYEVQQEVTYYYEDRSGKGKKAERLRANIFFDSVRKSLGERDLDVAIKEQRLLLEDLKEQQVVISDEQDLRRDCPYYRIILSDARCVESFAISEKRVSAKKRVMGYIVMLSNKLDLDASRIWETYGLRDEQEKYFSDMKGAMLDDRNPAWSEKGKEGRLFIHFIGLSVYSHIKHIWKQLALKDQFETVDAVIDEMKNIRCIEHSGKTKIITPFVGKQLKICEYYDLKPPAGCAPTVKGINSKTGRKNKKAAQE